MELTRTPGRLNKYLKDSLEECGEDGWTVLKENWWREKCYCKQWRKNCGAIEDDGEANKRPDPAVKGDQKKIGTSMYVGYVFFMN